MSHDSWPLPDDPFDVDPWLDILRQSEHPAFRLVAEEYRYPQVGTEVSAPETGSES